MMKHLTIIFLFWCVSVASATAASDITIARHTNAHIQMLQAQVAQLNTAVTLLSNEPLSDKDKFERIGEPGFVAIENALNTTGYTAKTFYQFGGDNSDAIETWLSNNSTEAYQLDSLKAERDSLMNQYEALMNTPKAGN